MPLTRNYLAACTHYSSAPVFAIKDTPLPKSRYLGAPAYGRIAGAPSHAISAHQLPLSLWDRRSGLGQFN